MSRGVGETAAVAGLPEPLVTVAAVVTQLGDPLVVGLLAVALAGWPRPLRLSRSHTRWVLVMVVLAAVVMVVLKTGIAAPRPPGATADGFGFPSGHTLMATVGYGALAWGYRRRWQLPAAAVVGVVGASRVLIGAHYLVDVVAGWMLGLGLLAVGHRWIRTTGQQQAILVTAVVAVMTTAIAVEPNPWYTPVIGAAAGALALVIRREEGRG